MERRLCKNILNPNGFKAIMKRSSAGVSFAKSFSGLLSEKTIYSSFDPDPVIANDKFSEKTYVVVKRTKRHGGRQ